MILIDYLLVQVPSLSSVPALSFVPKQPDSGKIRITLSTEIKEHRLHGRTRNSLDRITDGDRRAEGTWSIEAPWAGGL